MALKTSNNGPFTLPAMPAVGTTVAQSGTANTYGSYVQMTASTGEADFIVGVMISNVGFTSANAVPNYVAIAIGTGSAASEVLVGTAVISPRGTIAGSGGANFGGEFYFQVPIPVANATRIAVKAASDVASAYGWKITLLLLKQADVVDAGINESADTKAINGVSTSSVTTVNANQGTTQPVNFTGTGASAIVKSDCIDWAGTAITATSLPVGTAAGAAGGLLIAGSNADTTFANLTVSTLATLNALLISGNLTVSGTTTHTGNMLLSNGLTINQATTNGSALKLTGNGIGHGLYALSGLGSTGDGIKAEAQSTDGNGMTLAKAGTGKDLNATTTPLTLAKTTNLTGLNDIAATAIVSAGAINTSGGAVSTVTNLTNAPTNGDLTATMKASVTTAATAATPTINATQAFSNTGTWTGNIVGTLSTLTTYTGNTLQTGDSFARIGVAGVGLTNIVLPSGGLANVTAWTVAITGSITGSLSGSVGSVTGLTVSNLDVAVSTRATPAQVNTECDTALADYDAPTNAEMVARTLVAADYGTANNQGTINTNVLAVPAAITSDHGSGSYIRNTEPPTVGQIGTQVTTDHGVGSYIRNTEPPTAGDIGAQITSDHGAGSYQTATGFAVPGDEMTLDMTQAVPTTNTAQTLGDALNAARAQGFGKWALVGTTLTLYAADGTTAVRVFTLDSATAPTSRT